MSFQDQPRRQRPPRYPALAWHEDGFSSSQDNGGDYSGGISRQDGYQGSAGLAGAPRQRPPWEDPWEDPQRQNVWDSGSQQSLRSSGPQPPARGPGAHRAASAAQQASEDLNSRGARHGIRRGRRELLPGALAGFLAAAVALGVANLIAAFVRPQASPIIAVGEAFIDRTPPALKNFAVAKFGTNDKNMLLLGMYVTIALIAVTIGILAWRRLWIGVAGIGLFGLFGAFVAITRPESHVTDVIPSIVGGIAGIAAIVLLIRAGMPRARAALARER
jgi:hypothetical protein